ncbi:MAG TPA: YCF48-related protein [Blastocatellia bacterium]
MGFMKELTKRGFILLLCIGAAQSLEPQWLTQSSGTTVRLRGVSAVSATVAWASGSDGVYLKTTDGGAHWRAATVTGAEDLDFRDVEAFDADTAYLLGIGEGERSRIYKTTDGGEHWNLQFTNRNPKAFFDALAFWDADRGVAVSDSVDGRFVIIKTTDGGANWKEIPPEKLPPALAGEGAFAASGTCVVTQGRNNVWIATNAARVLSSTDGAETWRVATTPIPSGQPSVGIFSIAFKDARNGVVVGGDYKNEGEARDNVAVTNDGGRTWKPAKGPLPGGFRSAVAYAPGVSILVTVGPSGSDYSLEGGASWAPIRGAGYHALSFARSGVGWAVGEGGRVARFKAFM